jgi:hypothetical protein
VFEVELIPGHAFKKHFYQSELESPTNSIAGRALDMNGQEIKLSA